MIDLPNGWAHARLPDLITPDGVFTDGDWVESKDQDPNGDVRLIQLADEGDGVYVNKSNRFLTREKATELHCTFLLRGDLLVARMPDPLGRACIYPGDKKPAVTVVDVCVVRGNPKHFDQAWLMYFINTPVFRENIHALQSGSTRKRISRGNLSTLTLPVPPRPEQTRIVQKLEELLSELDAGVAELKVAQRKLARYRQSLLKAAVEGALTADWRKSQAAASTESGAELLARILRGRRARWEGRQLAKFKEQGKTPQQNWQAKYSEPFAPDANALPELAEGWTWASLDQLSEFITSGSRGWADYYAEQGATFIRSQNINQDWLDLSNIAFVNPPPSSEGARTLVSTGDLLLTITGANVGKAARVDIDVNEAYVSQHVALIRLIDAGLGAYLHLFLTADAGGRGQLNKEAYGAGKPGLNLQQVGSVAVRLPGEKELADLMQAVSIQFGATRAQVIAIARGLEQSDAQRKNILQAAFSGQLVPQDPTDEPASALLERIRTDRAARASDTSPRRRGARKAK